MDRHEMLRLETVFDVQNIVNVYCSCGKVLSASSGYAANNWMLPYEARQKWWKHSQRLFDNRGTDEI